MMNIDAVIFDLDGTLLDSEPNYYEADKRFMNELGFPLTEEMKQEFVGCGNLYMMRIIKERYNLPESLEALLERKERYYLELARSNTEMFPEMMTLVKRFHSLGLPQSVASGTGLSLIHELLEQVGMKSYFRELVSSEQVERGKPFPDVFLMTAEKLGVEPSRCLVLEDSIYGVLAAKRAGMYCVAIPSHMIGKLPEEYYQADILFEEGMSGFTAGALIERLGLV